MPSYTDFSETEYNKEVEDLFKRFPSVQKASFKDAYKPGLERMERFSAMLSDPHKDYRTIHIAGTNGKGSVANMLASVLSAAGVKVGLFTSPHITDFRERMAVAEPVHGDDGGKVTHALVPKEYVFDFIKKHKETFSTLGLSFFEITTAMAFKWFSDSGVDTAVIETGLGGRLDSTNIITPRLSIVTSIGLDHCEYLGHTLGEIASEKAGIFKNGVPALVGEVLPETEPVFVKKARETSSKLYFAERMEPSLWYQKDFLLENMDLQGSYQEKNLRTVLAAVDILKDEYPSLSDSQKTASAIVHTASRMDFHGRWERLSSNPDVICDIGHNAHALKNNFAQLDGLLSKGEYSSLIIVYAVMADKDLDAIMPLMPLDATYVFTTPSTERALPSEEILRRYKAFLSERGLPTGRLYSTPTVRKGIETALSIASMTDPRRYNPKAPQPLIYIGGSTFAVADAVPCFSSGK